MPKGNPHAKGQPVKPHKVKSIKLSDRLVPIAENSLKNATDTIEFGLNLIQVKAQAAIEGDESAIALLDEFGVRAETTEAGVIIVYKPDGEVGAWIF